MEKQNIKKQDVEKQKVKTQNTISEISNGIDEKVVREVLAQMGIQSRITFKKAKALIEKIEEESIRRGMNSVIAICGPEGNPIAVHVMDGAYLVSYDVAVKKAYTSVAVKMSTRELGELAGPGVHFMEWIHLKAERLQYLEVECVKMW